MGEESGEDKGGEDKGIKVGEETFTVEMVAAMAEENKTLKTGTEAVAEVTAFTAKHNITSKQFIEQSEEAFTVLNGLIEGGVIDNEGKVVVKELKALDLDKKKLGGEKNEDDVLTLDTVKELMEKTLKPYKDEIVNLKGDNNKLYTHALQSSISKEYPDATTEQIAQAIARGNRDKTKKIFGHVDDVLVEAVKTGAAAEEAFAKKYGLDLNELKEQGGDVTAETIVGKKRLSFKGGEGTLTPREAVTAFFKGKGMKG